MKMPRDDKADTPAEGGKPKKKSKLKFIIILVLILCILAGGGFAVWYFFFNSSDDSVDPVDTEKSPAFIFPPIDFTVNLADVDQRRYLRATVQLGFDEKKLQKEMQKKVPEIRDLIIDVFRSKTVSEINTPEGTDKLRRELKMELNARLDSGEIREVYFTEFIIQ